MKTNFSIDKAGESWLRDSRLFYNVGMVIKDSIPCFPLSKTIDTDATCGVAAELGLCPYPEPILALLRSCLLTHPRNRESSVDTNPASLRGPARFRRHISVTGFSNNGTSHFT